MTMMLKLALTVSLLPTVAVSFKHKSGGNRALASEGEGTDVLSVTERSQWWADLSSEAQDKLKSIFDQEWFDQQDVDTQTAYTQLASSLYDIMTSSADAHADDFYIGFAPILLRASFHSSGTYDDQTGTGGSNGGTIFNTAELEDENNNCIDKATAQLQTLFNGHQVPLADAAVIAGTIALDVMDFPRMDLVRIKGGRSMVNDVSFGGRLPSPDDDPMELFANNYGLTLEETVALVGGAHNFGSAHGKCAGYVGQWTSTPLSWFGPSESAPTFFPDLIRDDWRWYEVCTYENNTVSYVSIEDPFVSGMEEHPEDTGSESMACPMMQSRVPILCEEQAMRGCEFADGSYDLAESPCDINLLQMRLKSDFFLKENEMLLPHANEFARNPDLLAEQFGIAYHKVTHLGLDRCGLSGHGCTEGTVCSATPAGTCVVDADNFSIVTAGEKDSLGRMATLSFFIATTVLLLIVIFLLSKIMSKKQDRHVSSVGGSTADGASSESMGDPQAGEKLPSYDNEPQEYRI